MFAVIPRFVEGLTRYANMTAAVALALIVMVTVLSAACRFVFGFSIPDAEPICEMLLVIAVLMPLAAAQKKKEHVEVTLFTDKLTMGKINWLRRLGCFVGLCGFGILAYALVLGAWKGYSNNDVYMGVNLIVTWPARAAAALAVIIFAVRLGYEMLTGTHAQSPEKA